MLITGDHFTGAELFRAIELIRPCDNGVIDHTHQGRHFPSDHYPLTAILDWNS